jgi:hypothetical protein
MDYAGRRRASSWDGSGSRPSSSSSSRDQHQHYSQQQDQNYKLPGVYLRGIPKNTAAEVLEKHFESYGVSNVQIVPAPHYSTDIAFVNFHSESTAQQVRPCKACSAVILDARVAHTGWVFGACSCTPWGGRLVKTAYLGRSNCHASLLPTV